MQRSLSLPARSSVQRLATLRPWAPRAMPYLVPALAAFLATGTWFRDGAFVSTGDVAPFIRSNLAAEWGSAWGHSLSGAGSVSFQPVARTPELLTLWLGRLIGLDPAGSQRCFYGLLVVAAVVAVVWFASAFVTNPLARTAAGVVGFFNPFVLQYLPNPLPLWSIAVMAGMGGLIVRAGRGRPVGAVTLAAASVPTVYLAINPPLLAMTGVWVVLVSAVTLAVDGREAGRRVATLLLRAAPWAVAFNLWWLAPFVATLRSQGTGFVVQAQTDVLGWSWTQARASLANAVSLSTHWGWSYPQYFPYARSIDRSIWSPLRFGLPALAFASTVLGLPPRRRSAVVLAILAASLVFLAKGLNPPLAGINLFLYQQVPGMWLLREPMSKIGPILVLCYATMIAISLEGVREFVATAKGFPRAMVSAIVGVLAIGSVAFAYPLWTGQVIPDARPDLPPAHVRVPSAWLEVASRLNAGDDGGKVLVLPLDDFYQMPTTWGYYGVDHIPRSLLTRPTIQPLPASYYGEVPAVTASLDAVQSALLDGDPTAALPLLRALGVTDVVVREDLRTDFPKRPSVDVAQLQRGFADMPGVTRTITSSVADVYHVSPGSAAAMPVSDAHVPAGLLPSLVASLSRGQALVDDDAAAGAVVVGPGAPTGSFSSDGRRVRLVGRAYGPQMVSARVRGDEIRLRAATTVRLDGRAVGGGAVGSVHLPEGAAVAAIATRVGIVPVEHGRALVAVGGDPRIEVFGAAHPPSPVSFSKVRDCNAYDARSPRDAGLSATPAEGGVVLTAAAHSACVRTGIRPFAAGAPLLLRLSYRAFAGSPARLCMWQVGPDRCAATAPLATAPGWHTYASVIRPDRGTRAIQLYLYSDGDAPGDVVSRVAYRHVEVVRLRTLASTRVEAGLPRIGALPLPVGRHDLSVTTAGSASLAPLPYAVRDCHAYDDRTLTRGDLVARPLAGAGSGVHLEATAHAACVNAPVRGFVPGQTYELRLQARTLAGLPARVCLWQAGPDRCAPLPAMTQRGSSWGSYQATITPDPGTTGLSLFLYADAVRTTATGATITEYRDLAVRPSPPLAVSVIPVARSSAPDAQVRRTSQSSFALSVSRSARPFVLSIPESAADGWRLRGVPEDRVAGRVIVHGYAQGWLIEPGPAFEATATFDPDGLLVDGARGVSAAAALSAGFVAMMRRRRRRGERGGAEAAEDSETGSELDPTSAAAPTPWGPSWW